MNLKRHLIIFIAACISLGATAQVDDMRSLYNEAEEEYKVGRIEQAISLLEHNMSRFRGNILESVYRLLALCHLGIDQTEKAAEYTNKLLEEDRYYSTSPQDPQRFIDMVENIKSGFTATITTASSQAEDLSEVPVPATLITEEMIQNSGARNLQELLATYVPGMNIIDCNDDINIAMRGIYSNSQEKILIMLNGHRLNSYTTNSAAPDFSMSLEKIKQIEVLRGPASSLYGGVALTAVVNLITKQGADIDGVQIKGGLGNYGQKLGDIVLGKRYFDIDLLMWGHVYSSSGETRDVAQSGSDAIRMPEKTITIGRIGNKPSYDFGIQLKYKDLLFLYDTHFSEVVSPFTMTTLATSYNHEKYRTFGGIKPSFATKSHHADISYGHKFGKFNLRGNVTYDNSDLTHYQVLNDQPIESLGKVLSLPAAVDSIMSHHGGIARYIDGQEEALGARVLGDFNYISSNHHKGSMVVGAEYSHFNVGDVRYQIVYDFNLAMQETPTTQTIGKGEEDSYDFYAQLKHQWKSFIFNAGIRYDHKIRYNSTKLDEFSPRLALIYLQPKWNVKVSYSKSFVDAPYLYRKSNEFITAFSGGNVDGQETLRSEIVKSWQLTFAGKEWFRGFNFEINGFFNRASDLIMTHVLDYVNGGQNKTLGIEFMAGYQRPRFTADFNFTWTNTFKSNILADEILASMMPEQFLNTNNNTPAIMSNLVLGWHPADRLKLFTNIRFEGKQTTYNTDVLQLVEIQSLINKLPDYSDNPAAGIEVLTEVLKRMQNVIYHEDMDPRVIVNIGGEYKIGKLALGLNVYNLLNTRYYRSGMNTRLIPQKGLWLMGTIAYKF